MALFLASADAFPYLAGLFSCDACERTEPTEGRSAAVPPAGWVSTSEQGKILYFCPHCAPSRPATR